MKIISYKSKIESKPGIILNGEVIDLALALRSYYLIRFKKDILTYNNIVDYLKNGLIDLDILKNLQKWVVNSNLLKDWIVKGKVKLLIPIIPGKIITLGRNFASHAKEQNAPVPKEPIIFEKANSSVIGPDENVVYKKFLVKMDPKNVRIDHEVELAVVIGKLASNVKKKNAFNYVFGYTILNDVTARNVQNMDFKASQPWFRSKSIDTFCPIGPWIVTKDEIKNPHNLNLELRVNGKIRQKNNTKTMIFKIPEIIEYITTYLTLMPGDIISTGTPEGISPVYPGDIMEAKIEKIGVLRNKVVKEN
ncbi:MAG: fumarylacetoacetate hydrolase family protein [Candidatus Firestonebacteria bacterium]